MTNEHTCGGCGSEMSRSEIQAMAFVRVADEWIAAPSTVAPNAAGSAVTLMLIGPCFQIGAY